MALYTYVAALLIMAIHTWIAIRWSSFVVNMGVGIVMMVAAGFVIMSKYAPYFPWSMPFLFGNGMMSGDVYPNLLWASSIGFVVLGLLGQYARRPSRCELTVFEGAPAQRAGAFF